MSDPVTTAEVEIDYLDALARELTEDVRRAVYKLALRFCYGLSRAGVRVDPDFAKDLVADAIADTVSGERRWDASRCTLAQHLRGVVRSRVSHVREHQRQFPRVGVANDEQESGGVTVAHGERLEALTLLRDLAQRVFKPLYAAANDNDDPAVAGLLDAYSEGIVKRAEVAEHVGMSVKDYDRARDRLGRMIMALPEDVRRAVAESIGGAR